jgi:hypothetical protein
VPCANAVNRSASPYVHYSEGLVRAPRLDRRWAIPLGVVVTAALGCVLWYRRPAAPRWVTAEVTRGPVVRAITTTGAVDPVITVLVGA